VATPAPASIPVGWVKYTSASGKWSVYFPPTWEVTKVGTYGDAVSTSAPQDSSFSFFIFDALAWADSPADHLAKELDDKRISTSPNTTSNGRVFSLNGRPTTNFDYFFNDQPTFKSRQINVFLDGKRNTVQMNVKWREGRAETEELNGILNTIQNSVVIMP
jgi:hypothetical protein